MAKKGLSMEERIQLNFSKIESANTNNETENNSNVDTKTSTKNISNTNTDISTNVDTKTEISATVETNTSFIVKKKAKAPKEEHISTYLRSDLVEYRKSLKELGYTLKEIDNMIYDFARENMKIER